MRLELVSRSMCEKRLRILIYQRMWGFSPNPPPCGCEFIYDRSRWQEADAVVFHIPELNKSQFPPRKLKNQYWVAWCVGPRALAAFLVELAADDETYVRYLQWKLQPLRSRSVVCGRRHAQLRRVTFSWIGICVPCINRTLSHPSSL